MASSNRHSYYPTRTRSSPAASRRQPRRRRERWQKIDRIYGRALDLGRDSGARAALLDELCAGDADLRRSVESLPACEPAADTFLDTSALDIAAHVLNEQPDADLVGCRIGPYVVEAWLGSGGRGDVYRARDDNLHRDVALKILPELFALDPDASIGTPSPGAPSRVQRIARFKQEAQVLASLDHPNIAAIRGFEESGDICALVLELVEGPTLAERIAQGPIDRNAAAHVWRQQPRADVERRWHTRRISIRSRWWPARGEAHVPESWIPSGGGFLFSVAKGDDMSLWTYSIHDRQATPFGEVHSSLPTGATFSPDGRWVAYASADLESASTAIYVQPFPATGARYPCVRQPCQRAESVCARAPELAPNVRRYARRRVPRPGTDRADLRRRVRDFENPGNPPLVEVWRTAKLVPTSTMTTVRKTTARGDRPFVVVVRLRSLKQLRPAIRLRSKIGSNQEHAFSMPFHAIMAVHPTSWSGFRMDNAKLASFEPLTTRVKPSGPAD